MLEKIITHKLVFVILQVIQIFLSTKISAQSLNCHKYNETDLPTVQIYDAADAEPNYDHNGTVILQIPKSETGTFGWIGLECSYSKPIRWVFNLDYGESGRGESYALTARDVTDFYAPETYQFRAEVELKVHTKGRKFVMACVAFENMCNRRLVQTEYNKTQKRYILQSLPKSEENQTSVTELEQAMLKGQDWESKYGNKSFCPVKFSLFDNGETYKYTFEPEVFQRSSLSLPDRQNLENSFLYSPLLSRDCFTDTCKKENNTCYVIDKKETKRIWPTVIFLSNNSISRVIRMYHTFATRKSVDDKAKGGKLKFAWESSDSKDLVKMEVFNERAMEVSKVRLYMGEVVTVKCHASPFLFSFGTIIGYWSDAISIGDKITFLNNTNEDTVLQESREASAEIDIPLKDKSYNLTIYCFSPIWNSTEWVNSSQTLEINAVESKISVKGSNKLIVQPINTRLATSCNATGTPLPSLRIETPGNNTRVNVSTTILNGTVYLDIIIANLNEHYTGVYNCIATNSLGVDFFEFKIQIENTKSDSSIELNVLSITLIAAFGSLAVIGLAIVIFLVVRFRFEKEEFRRLTEEAVREFYEGVGVVSSKVADSPETHHYVNDSVKSLPYDTKYEVPRKHWSFTATILGSGAFGMIQRGMVEIGSKKQVIAVKTVKSIEDIADFKANLLELKIMAHIGHHKHIVKLIAASTHEIQNRRILIGIELCANGSLLTYLQKRKRLFNNLVEDGKIHFKENQKNKATENEELYENLITSDVSTVDLFKWSFQIASGMDFLESRNVLHADLAARNVLLTDNLVAKISDFGLSRELFENSEYTKKTQVPLPWKWMAIESLHFLKFSIKSDVWSYGVTLYEVFGLGEEPYPGQTWNEEFTNLLENGMRPNQPTFCTDNVYNRVMMPCWQKEPNDRIRFADVMSFFGKAIGLLTSSKRNDDECRDFC